MAHCLFPDKMSSWLNENELEKLLSDSGLKEFKDKIKNTIVSSVG